MKSKTELVIVTGLSGAGKHQLLYQLEDLGYFCVDNLPAPLMLESVRLLAGVARLAIGADVRTRMFLADLQTALAALRKARQPYRIIFLEAAETALVRRFAESRRPHPVSGTRTLTDRIRREAAELSWLREQADLIIDTTRLSPPELKGQLSEWLQRGRPQARLMVSSFGYKYGLPDDADFIFDVRFLPNPFYVPKLKNRNGTDRSVREFIFSQTVAREAIDQMQAMIEFLTPHFLREGKMQLHVAVGCTGGQHRSVAVAAELHARLRSRMEGPVTLLHRELAGQAGAQHE